jgi:transcriptional regulator GlxA family with amidase domain
MNVTVVAFEDCMTSAVTGLLDAFALAERLSRVDRAPPWRHQVRLASVDGHPVRGFGGFPITPRWSIAQCGDSDIVIIPAILGDIETVLGRERQLVDWLASCKSGRRLLASACTGAFLLAEAGLLEGRRITTNPMYRTLFESRYPSIKLALGERMVEDRQIICAGSTSAVLDLAVHLVDRLGGHDLATSTAKALSIDRNPGTQLPYLLFIAPRDHGDEGVLRVQDWVELKYAQPTTLADMAAAARMSVRSLNRRFRRATGRSPLDYVRIVRMETAKRLLESGDMTVQRISDRVGYADTRSFVRAFGAWAGLSPHAYRTRFRSN